VYASLYKSSANFEVAIGVVAFSVKHSPDFVLETLGDERTHLEIDSWSNEMFKEVIVNRSGSLVLWSTVSLKAFDVMSHTKGFPKDPVLISGFSITTNGHTAAANTGGLLQPLPMPTRVWKDISMDFIIGLPVYKGLSVNFVVVDRFTKYAHFGALPTSFNAPKMADIFIYLVVKFHAIPKTIMSILSLLAMFDSTCAINQIVGRVKEALEKHQPRSPR
nr:Ty3/gypsy retrotransposon protein [Tanacetum cinerariifolium]